MSDIKSMKILKTMCPTLKSPRLFCLTLKVPHPIFLSDIKTLICCSDNYQILGSNYDEIES